MGEPPPPPSLPPKELPINRYKFIWRVLMISNLALGAYMFIGARKRDVDIVKKKSVGTGVKKNHNAVVEEPPASATPATPATTTTDSKTWDM